MKRLLVAAASLSTLLLASLTVFGQTQSREDLLREIEAKRTELNALEKAFLSPSEEDRMTYAAFLRTPDTGLIRLLPREKYDGDANKTNMKTLWLRGGGAYYSFARLSQEYGQGSDIVLHDGQLSVGFAGVDYGLLTNLGDIPLESITVETPAANIFATYTAAADEQQARAENRRFARETELEGLKVKSDVPMRLNSTYLLRAVSLSRSDVLVAFRVVRVDSDKSATILWKLLKKYPTPKLASSNN